MAVSEAADPQSWMRCPLCAGQFELRTAIEIQPPMLEPIAPPGNRPPPISRAVGTSIASRPYEPPSPSATLGAAKAALPDFPTLHPEHALEPGLASLPESGEPHSPSIPKSHQIEKPSSDTSQLAAHFESIPVSDAVEQRVARANRNPAIELLKIVLGGAMGLLLGYAVLLWGFKVDPFNLAPRLPPSTVPANLHPHSP